MRGRLRSAERRELVVRRALVILIVLGIVLLVGSGVALAEVITGGPGDNKLIGTNRPDLIDGQGGNDKVFGQGGDSVFGAKGDDDLLGGKDLRFYPRNEPGSDRLYGQQGDDRMDGDRGADRLYGGPGDDQMQDGEDRGGPREFLSGGSGDDAHFPVQENPAAEDIVHCGGKDIVYADRKIASRTTARP